MNWWAHSDLNRGPSDYESPALTAELWAHQRKLHFENHLYRFSSCQKISRTDLILRSDTKLKTFDERGGRLEQFPAAGDARNAIGRTESQAHRRRPAASRLLRVDDEGGDRGE